MANEKKKRISMVSPRITFRFPKLTEPDYGTKEFPKDAGEYSVQGLMQADSAEARQFLAKLQPHYDEAISEAKVAFKGLKVETRKKLGEVKVNDLYTTLYDQETEEPTGEISFKFAMPASFKVKKGKDEGKIIHTKPAIVDAKGVSMRKVPAIWGGTIGKVSFELSPYFIPGTGVAGLKLRLVGAQIIDLKTAGERSASSMGFGVEEGFSSADIVDEDADGDNPYGGGEDKSADEEEFPQDF